MANFLPYIQAGHMSSTTGRYRMVRPNHFRCHFNLLGDNVDFAVHSVSLPTYSIEVQEVPFGNDVRKVPGGMTVAELTLSVRDLVKPETFQDCWSWFTAVGDPETGAMEDDPELYLSEGTIYMVNSKGTVKYRHWTLEEAWISNMTPGTLSQEDKTPIIIEMTIQAFRAYPVFS